MFLRNLVYYPLYFLGYLLSKLLFKLTIVGQENIPEKGPLIVISNHFSWFEAPLVVLNLPYRTAFVAAAELKQLAILRLFFYAGNFIPVIRGQADRTALRETQKRLEQGDVIAIFPEGGIDPAVQDTFARGESAALDEGNFYRESGQLMPVRPGTAYLAVRSQAPILPIAFLGTEKTLPNIKRGRRTAVTMTIGKPFGPLTLAPSLRGPAKRQRIDELGELLMRHLADLLPPENRGPYA